ncbi:MAG TPA: trimethylamine methyltransferase family protein [Anaerolineales bacterium]|nr:trimethylamine methyltransferase family protein [Anaerolineales bacterium]
MNTLKVLSDSEVESMYEAALRILAEVGVILTHPGARQLMTDAGATIKNDRVYLPPELVENCLAKCPSQVKIQGRNGTTKTLGDGSINFHNLGGARDIHNLVTDEHRFAILQDVRDSTRLLDALPNCNTINPFFTPSDVPGDLMALAMYRYALPFTTKPLQGPGVQFASEVRYIAEMAAVLGPVSDVLTLSISPVSPLALPNHAVEAILEIARRGIPFSPLPSPTAGATAPFSIAGAVTQQAAEVLSALVLAQLVQPGLPMIFCGRLSMMDPRTGIAIWGGIEMGLASAGTVQMGHRCKLPVNVYGFSTNSHALDLQNGFERALNAVIPALAGADELSGIGEMEAGNLSTYAQMVADNDFASSIHRVRRGYVANEDTLAVDVIATVMEGPRNFLGQKHTLNHMKGGEIFLSKLTERGSWESWDKGGRRGFAEQAQAESERILREHQVEPLAESQSKELDAIMASAEKELVKS